MTSDEIALCVIAGLMLLSLLPLVGLYFYERITNKIWAKKVVDKYM